MPKLPAVRIKMHGLNTTFSTQSWCEDGFSWVTQAARQSQKWCLWWYITRWRGRFLHNKKGGKIVSPLQCGQFCYFNFPPWQPWYRVTIWENMIYSGPLFYMILYRMNSYYLQARLAQISQNHWFILVFCASTRGIMRVLQYLNISAAYWGRSCCYASYESHVSPLSYAIW